MMEKELQNYKQESENLKTEKADFQLKIEEATRSLKEELDSANDKIL